MERHAFRAIDDFRREILVAQADDPLRELPAERCHCSPFKGLLRIVSHRSEHEPAGSRWQQRGRERESVTTACVEDFKLLPARRPLTFCFSSLIDVLRRNRFNGFTRIRIRS